MRTDPRSAFSRVVAALERCATGSAPVRMEVGVLEDRRAGESPLVAEATRLLGSGRAQHESTGDWGEIWRTWWTVDGDDPDFEPKRDAIIEFAASNFDVRKILSEVVGGEPILQRAFVVFARWEPTWKSPDGSALAALPPLFQEANQVLLSLGPEGSAIMDVYVPFAAVGPEFARWERAFSDALHLDLIERRWSLVWVSNEGWDNGHKSAPAGYRRSDWADGGRIQHAPARPWDAMIDRLTAPGNKALPTDRLADHPLGPVVFALVVRAAALKGGQLDRAVLEVQFLLERSDDRVAAQPALDWLFGQKSVTKVSRELGSAFLCAAEDGWFIDHVREILGRKRVPAAFWPFLEALAFRRRKSVNPELAGLWVEALRVLRKRGSTARRRSFQCALAETEDGSAWATWLLEAASSPPKYDHYESWPHVVLGRWETRHLVDDPFAEQWVRTAPIAVKYDEEGYEESQKTQYELDDSVREMLEAHEAEYVRVRRS